MGLLHLINSIKLALTATLHTFIELGNDFRTFSLALPQSVHLFSTMYVKIKVVITLLFLTSLPLLSIIFQFQPVK